MTDVKNGIFNLPFEEQIAFFRQKTNLPSEAWDSIWKDAHDRAFIVAGATKAELINDFRLAIDRSISEGKSIQWFRKEFDVIVAKHGWTGWAGEKGIPLIGANSDDPIKAGRDWRTRVIYRTNLASSHAAGRWAQLNDPELLAVRPFWKYIHSDTVSHPRPIHKSWNGVVLRYDDPWWKTHFCPNGWGCQCRIKAVRPSEFNGKPAPNDGFEQKIVNGKTYTVPKGIDVGWDYVPGANVAKTLTQLVEEKAINYPPAIAQALHTDLRAGTPPSLLSSFVSVPNKADPINATVNTVLQQIDSVHNVAYLPKSYVKTSFDFKNLGTYNTSTAEISISSLDTQPELTLVHEIGHLIDRDGMGVLDVFESKKHPLLEEWRNAVSASTATAELNALFDKTKDAYIGHYLLSPEEQWARSYSQYIAIKTKDATLLRQIKECLDSVDKEERYSQWQYDEFLPILNAIDNLFVLLGWKNHVD